ncbi:hypothetical protein R50072_32260 [Simiduia litorea]
MNSTVNPKLATTLIMLFSIGIPAYLLNDVDWSKFEVTSFVLLVSTLYAIFISLVCFMVMGIKGPDVTSKETDGKINTFRLRVAPYIDRAGYIILAGILIYLTYLLLMLWLPS